MKIKVHFALVSSIIFLFLTLIITNIFSSPDQRDMELSSAQSLFISDDDYIKHLKTRVNFKDINLNFVKIKRGDNFWKLSKKYKVNIDTMIGANPHLNSLLARVDQEVVVPDTKGVIHFVNNLGEIDILSKKYEVHKDSIIVQDLPPFYKYYYKVLSSEEPIAVFIKDTKPSTDFMTDKLAEKFKIREMFVSPLGGRRTSSFGKRTHPIFKRKGFHNGMDIAARHGTPVGAARSGRVVSTGRMGGYGLAVIIKHDNGFKTLYGHLSSIWVRPGQYVHAHKGIGKVGSTGWSTGPHLHFTIWKKGKLIDPSKILW